MNIIVIERRWESVITINRLWPESADDGGTVTGDGPWWYADNGLFRMAGWSRVGSLVLTLAMVT